MIIVSCEIFANFLDKVSKSTRTKKGNVKLSLSNYDENYKVAILTINSVDLEVNSNKSNNKIYVIKNVEQAVKFGHLRNDVSLVGYDFSGLRVIRKRCFEIGCGTEKIAMGIDWIKIGTKKKQHEEINNAIPPAYTRFIGQQLVGRV